MPEQIIENLAPLQIGTVVDVLAVAQEQIGDKALIEMLKQAHPTYATNAGMWQMMGDIALNRIFDSADKTRYLIQGDVEEMPHFKKRTDLSAFLPETPSLLSDFIGAVFSKPALREFTEPDESKNADPAKEVRKNALQEKIKDFIDDAGAEGQPITRMAEMAARMALVYGSVDAVLDHPPVVEGEEGTVTPQIILYTPEQRLDWQEDVDGNFLWVKYWFRQTIKPGLDQPRIIVDEYRIFTSEMIIPVRVLNPDTKDEQVLTFPPIEHAFPSIPVRTLYWQKLEAGLGDPWVKPLVEGDIKAFRQESDVTWDIFVHAHPWILAWLHKKNADHQPLSEMRLGTQWGQHLDPGNEERAREDMQYLAPDTAELALQMDSARDTREMVRRLAGNGQDGVQKFGGQPESGVALAYRLAQRSKNFIQLARGLQEWEWQILELVANEGQAKFIDITESLEVRYPDKFDQRQVEELHQDLQSAQATGSPTLVKEIRKELASKLLGDGATQSVLDEIQEEIEEGEQVAISEPEDGEDRPEAGAPTQPGTAQPAVAGQPGAAAPDEEVIDFNELTLALERFTRIGDLELLNELRAEIARRLGQPPPAPLTEADLQVARPQRQPGAAPPPPEEEDKD